MIRLEQHLQSVAAPANLRINDQINAHRAKCLQHGCTRPYHHFAFGQSPFAPPPSVVEALRRHAGEHSYLPTAGLPQLREAVANYYAHHFGIDCAPDQIMVTPGSKEMIAIALAVLEGPVIIPTPSWVSYLPQARILRKEVIDVRTHREDGFKLTPDLLERGARGHQQSILILNQPNNPTGAVYSENELRALADVCRAQGVIVIADEIYAGTAFEQEQFTSMMRIYPEGTVVTGGLSKDRSSGGYRLGVGLFPRTPEGLLGNALKVAGSTYSCVAAPIQHAALEAYRLGGEVDDYVRACREVNALIGRKTAASFSEIAGVKTSTPAGAFYLFVDFNAHGNQLAELGLDTCASLCEDVLRVEHTAMLPGESLLLPPGDYAVRCSFVDYDGDAALVAWRSHRPTDPATEDDFFRTHAPLITRGVDGVAQYFEIVRSGGRPEHV